MGRYRRLCGVFVGHSDGFGITSCGLSPFLHSKGLGLVSAFLRELACLENSIIEPEFCHRIGS